MKSPLKRSQDQEKKLADRYDGTVNSGSGNGWIHKNDVRSERFSFEAKTTEKKSYSLKVDELIKAEKNALISGREMVFAVELGGRNWMVLSQETFDTLLDT
ncbi:hypothetical protein [Streptomyces sp. H27-C3]|uniref:hypothetical protein n=1 Tax=Streptomyces sp. H27-C3 TaxID=3046305 RepID=UPI0024BAFA8E|nr:hypothetical protein [Streptomyces sp. H27-C3]MDJ0463168.1 hypothetical protein [Streptomyces sp. H27-C3]